uniref:Uncharacterized protein n=1 Tax=Angomonas deanei TaxID=59799 RepID=C6K3Q6_9TRYP|nr:conserved hypothetical protein [Angomonas deanei]
MYGGYYGMNPGMRGNYSGGGGGPVMQQQPLHMQARMRGPMGPSPPPGRMMNGGGHAMPNGGGGGGGGGGVQSIGGMTGMMPGGPMNNNNNNSNGGGGAGNPAVHQLNRNPSFMMMHNQNNFGGPAPSPGTMRRSGSIGSMGSMGVIPHFGSFSAQPGNLYPPGGVAHGAGNGNASSVGSFSSAGAGSLHRMNSGMNFDYYTTTSQMNLGAAPLSRNNSNFASMRRGSFMGAPPASNAGPAGQPQQLSRQNSALNNSYSYGSFRQPSFTQGSARHGPTGVGPNMSMNSIGSGASSQHDFGSSLMGAGDSGVSPSSLSRQDSTKSLQRSYSIAGQFYNYGNMNNGMGPATGPAAAAGPPGAMGNFGGPGQGPAGMSPQLQQQQQQRLAGPMGMSAQNQMMMMQKQMMMQRRLGNNGNPADGDPNAPPPKGTSENVVVEEGQSMALGRKNSVQGLTRKASEKRVGMYFKNKDASDAADGANYKKEGDTGTLGKNNARARDPSLTNTVKASIVLDTSAGANPAIEVDGRTIRAEKPGAEEVQKYDMRDVLYANRNSDMELMSDSIEEMRDNFVYGCNVGMVMADAGMSAARPTEWFTWLALKSVVKGTFGKLSSTQFEFTMSMCLLQDDQVMDLLADEPQRFVTLTVAESPLFGNVANGMVYVCVEDAGEFNDVLESCLYRAQQQCSAAAEEHGIVLCTCVLKQVKTSPSSGKQDVIVSSIFASGVGDGVIHYNRILDKNPAEPRALFYSVLHRSVHCTALFSCATKDEDIFNYLATLQRFSKTETRRPKVGSTRAFVSYGTSTIPKIREDLEKATDPRQKMMMQRQLEKLELMVADAEEMLENPNDSVPKTYI